ncbi:MAG: hypothetical protein ACUZ8H_10420 [Candidatus Anammoxibacter sp.]
MKNILLVFARLMQVAGIILLVYALYFGIAVGSMGKELTLLGIGAIIFYIGWAIQNAKFR